MQPSPFAVFAPIPLTVKTAEKGEVVFTIQRPDSERVKATQAIAKNIFVEAFETSYRGYYEAESPGCTIEQWLRLKTGIKEWLSETFDEEYGEYLEGKKGFVHLNDPAGNLVGWLSHSPVDEKGDLYLSQCSLEASWRNKKISTNAFGQVLNSDNIVRMFPDAKEVKLIVRKINRIAQCLYRGANF